MTILLKVKNVLINKFNKELGIMPLSADAMDITVNVEKIIKTP